MKIQKIFIIIAGIIVLMVIGAFLFIKFSPQSPQVNNVVIPAQKDDLILVSNPLPGQTVTSPLVVVGEARGNWYFEASFPVVLLDANGKILAQVPAQAQGEWMTTDYVPFSVSIEFSKPDTLTGTLILKKDNPSGLPENDNELIIPVNFQ